MPRRLSSLWNRSRRRMRVNAARSNLPQHTIEVLLAVCVGVLGAGGAVAFRWLLDTLRRLFFGEMAVWLEPIAPYHLLILPVLGAMLVGPLVAMLGPWAGGSGVPELQEAAALRGGRLSGLRWLGKALASALTIGSGNSAGREGPIAFIGASLAADFGRLFPGGERQRKLLFACGAAAGVAATFNAPLAGAFFALEIVLGTWGAETFAPVVVSAVVSSAIGRHVFGSAPAFDVPQYSLATFAELPVFAVLGLLAATVGVLFITALYAVGDLWDRLRMPRALRFAPAALLVGALGLWDPGVMGLGYDTISATLQGEMPGLGLLLLLMLGKLVATSLTLGSGGSGGIFTPSLFIGAMLGGAVGVTVHGLVATHITSAGAYALVGMGGVFAACSHAPITAVLTIFELTGDYRMILPLMLTCGIATVAARHMRRTSIYNLKLLRRGVHLELGRDVSLLNELLVRDAMTTDLVTVRPDDTGHDAMRLLEESTHHGFPLVDEQGLLHGIVTADDLRQAAEEDRLDEPITSIATHRLVVAFPEETLNDALRKLGMHHVGRAPVVAPDDHRKILGIITDKDIVAAYNHALIRQHTDLQRTARAEWFE
ncbi:MAG: chloride channel protein [Armatimonadota bacterium]